MAPRVLQQSFVGGEVAPRMFGRPDDVRFRHGAEKLQNYLTLPQGPAQKRPGFQFVREVKNSDNETRLIPFTFSQDQSLMIEMGRDTVQSREIGYFRFHTEGQTVLFDTPAPWVAGGGIDGRTGDVFDLSPSHSFQTGDPILFTMYPAGNAGTFSAGTPGTVNETGHGYLAGQQVMYEAQAGAALPPEVVDKRVYYVSANGLAADSYQIAETPGGNDLAFSAASSGTINTASMPSGSTPGNSNDGLYARRIYYAIRVDTDELSVAATREDALAGIAITLNSDGTLAAGDITAHYAYQIGDLVTRSGAAYYCFRRPHGEEDTLTLTQDDHSIPAHRPEEPGGVNYWYEYDTAFNLATTFDLGADHVDLTGHGRAAGETVIFGGTGTLPTPLVKGTTYYLVNPGTDDFQVAAIPGGAAIDLGGAPSGTITVIVGSILEVPHFFDYDEIFEVTYAQSNDVLTLCHPDRPALELRRLGATHWVVDEVKFNSASAPLDVSVVATAGYGFSVAGVTAATPAVITTNRAHGMTALTSRFFIKGIGDVPDGVYVASAVSSTTITLAALGTHEDVGSGSTTVTADAVVQPDVFDFDFEQTYVVTSLGSNNEESGPSAEFAVVNHMLAEGAFNTITWSAVAGASRYRIYKKESGVGVFGFIGEVNAGQPLSFEDNNVEPDLSITAPLLDTDLRRQAVVIFDDTNDRVQWAEHGLADSSPVIFQSTGDLPAALTAYATYYVVDASPNSFQVSETIGGTALALTGGDASTGEDSETHEATAGIFPAAVGYYEQRRVFGGSRTARQRVSLTGSGTESDLSFSIPTVDSDRISFDVAARQGEAIRHVVPLSHLMILSNSTEFRVTPINADALVPDSVSVRPQSFVGADYPQPAVVNNVGIFAADRGGHVREMGFSQEIRGYLTGDLSLRAVHLFDGLTIRQLAYSKAPYPIVWAVSSGGLLLGMTYIPEEGVGAWHRHQTDGTFESCAVIPEGEEDHLYVVVRRTINGNTVRYVERMANIELGDREDAIFMDAALTYDGTATVTITGLDHLEGETVRGLADGIVFGVTQVITVSGGQITLPAAASKVHVGLSYLAELKSLPVAVQIEAFGLDRTKNVNQVWVRVEGSGQFQVGPDDQHLRMSEIPASTALLNTSEKILVDGNWQADGQVVLRSAIPLPLTVVSLVYETQVGG